jgi:uncharacterized protein
MKKFYFLFAAMLVATTLQAEPKKLLVVTTTTGFRHGSIPTLEKVLAQIGKESGVFTVDFVQQPPGKPTAPKKPKAPAADAPESAKQAHKLAEEKFKREMADYKSADNKWQPALKAELQKLSPENLNNYDGVVFASTTGDLPIPDLQGLLDWIKAGHAFIGIHAASDTFHGYPEFIAMLGGEFKGHGPQVSVECLNQDPAHPANEKLGKTWTIQQEEIYEFKSYDPAKVHDLLILDKHPQTKVAGEFPVTWAKNFGSGRVFYTSLGHREDVIDGDPSMKDRKNSQETSRNFQAHVLGGIEWALKLKDGKPTSQIP